MSIFIPHRTAVLLLSQSLKNSSTMERHSPLIHWNWGRSPKLITRKRSPKFRDIILYWNKDRTSFVARPPNTHTQQHDGFLNPFCGPPRHSVVPPARVVTPQRCWQSARSSSCSVEEKKPLRFQNSHISPLSKVICIVTHYIWKPTKKKNEERSSCVQHFAKITRK